MSLKNDILAYVDRHNHVSFVELARLPGFDGGHWAICMSGYENIIFWARLTAEAFETTRELHDSRQIRYQPTSPLVYFIDGCVPRMPIAKSVRQYKCLHWLPVTVCRGVAADHPRYA